MDNTQHIHTILSTTVCFYLVKIYTIMTFKAFIDRTATLYLCELIEQQTSTTNTWLAGDAFLLKLPPPS